MLDIGWTELLVIAVVLIVVVGPKDLPPMLRAFGKMMTKLRAMAGDFRQQFDDALREADLDDVRKTIGDAQKLNPVNSLREAINPLRQTANEIKADLQRSTAAKTEVPTATTPVAPLAETPPVVTSPVDVPAVAPVVAADVPPAGVIAPVEAVVSIEKTKAARKPRAAAKTTVVVEASKPAPKPRKPKAKAVDTIPAEPAKKTARVKKTAVEATKKGDA